VTLLRIVAGGIEVVGYAIRLAVSPVSMDFVRRQLRDMGVCDGEDR
jgi:hypothetical protein